MATKCETWQARITELQNAIIPNLTTDLNTKKASAVSWASSWNDDFAKYRCGEKIGYINLDNILNTAPLYSGDCKAKKIGEPCSEDGCKSRIDNDVNPAIQRYKDAVVALNTANGELASTQNLLKTDKDCAEQVKDFTNQQNLNSEANRKVRNNIIILVVVILIIVVGFWAYRRFIRKGK